MTTSIPSRLTDRRAAEIAALARTVDARMADDDTSTGGDTTGDSSSATSTTSTDTTTSDSTGSAAGDRASSRNADTSGSDTRTGSRHASDDGDGTDWKRESRKHEQRAKANKDAADKAAEDKSTAEQGKAAAEAKNAELLDQLGKLLGFKTDDAPPDPAKLQQAIADRDRDLKSKDDVVAAKDEEIASRDRAIAARDVELAAWREAMKQGVDAVTLLDLRSTERRLGALDPAAEDFPKLLTAAVKELAEANPALRINAEVPDPARAGIGTAGSGDAAHIKPGTGRLRAAYSTT